jgi:hypothetical protein
MLLQEILLRWAVAAAVPLFKAPHPQAHQEVLVVVLVLRVVQHREPQAEQVVKEILVV